MAVPMTQALERLSADLMRAASTTQAVAIRRAMLPVAEQAPEKVRQSALDSLPHGGGLNEWVADSVTKVIPTTRAGAQTVTVRTRRMGRKQASHLRDIDRGQVRHPIYGHRSAWRTTRVRPGFFTRPMDQLKAEMTVAMRAAAHDVARSLTRG